MDFIDSIEKKVQIDPKAYKPQDYKFSDDEDNELEEM